MNLNDVTLIVPTKNESQNINRFLDSVPDQIRVIIVDASSDNTRTIIRKRNRKNIHILRDFGNIPTARQIGAEDAKTQWILFSDADVLFSKNYFERLNRVKVKDDCGGLVGAKRSLDSYGWYYNIFSKWLGFCCIVGLPAGSGSNMLIRRKALFQTGGFDCGLSCNEDTDLIYRIHKTGYRIEYHRQLTVYEFDHRRLDKGCFRKTLHSLLRCALLFCGFRTLLRRNDWGYWSPTPKERYQR